MMFVCSACNIVRGFSGAILSQQPVCRGGSNTPKEWLPKLHVSNNIYYLALYDHQPAILENIRQETVAILNDALIQRGFAKAISQYSSYCIHVVSWSFLF